MIAGIKDIGMYDIFSKLEKYKRTEKIHPEENYFTEAFAYILNRNKNICIELTNKITDGMMQLNKRHLKIKTQEHYGKDSIIDIVIKDNTNLLFIEIKLKADLNVYKEYEQTIDQIEKYYAVFERVADFKNKIVVLLAYEDAINEIKKKRKDYANSENIFLISWNSIYKILFGSTKSEDCILPMFREFMKEKGMSNFEGFKKDIFLSLGYDKEELIVKEEFVIKKYFESFSKGLYEYLNKNDNDKWKYFTYSFDRTNNRIYNHFYFEENNLLGLNINTILTGEGISTHIWLPLWDAKYDENKEKQGKINQKELKRIIYNYKDNACDIAEKFYDIFEKLDVTFSMSLNAKQYEHKKLSDKKAQGMQKGHNSPILTIENGSNLIFSKKDNSLLIDYD